jgi:hypothetical protein
MTELGDYRLDRTTEVRPTDEPPPPPGGPPVLWIVVALLAIGAGIVIGFLLLRRPEPVAAPPPEPLVTEGEVAPPGPAPEPVALPALDASDALVRELARLLSSHPRLAVWLATDGVIRRFTVAVDNVANGVTPDRHTPFLAPAGDFLAAGSGERYTIDARSYARYDAMAEVVNSIDAAGAARMYVTLEPLIEEAYRELGHPEGGFSTTLRRAFDRLLATPVVDGDVPLVPRVITYEFADPRLAALSPVQKQFLGMGPRNMRTVQGKIRQIAEELGMQ